MVLKNKTLSSLLQKRKELVQLIFIAIILAIGVSFLATAIPQILSLSAAQIFWLGLISVFVGLAYLSVLIIRARTGKTVIKAAVFINPKSKKTIAPLHYSFMYDLSRTLNAVFQENSALEETWKSHPLTEWHQENENSTEPEVKEDKEIAYFSIIKLSAENDNPPSKPSLILTEATEFVILEQLSNHLSEYFDNSSMRDNVAELLRKDIPHILLENRVLNILTTPIEDRPIFSKAKFDKSPEEGELVSIRGSDGSVYEKFDLMLPVGTNVSRSDDGGLVLDSKRVELSIRCIYEGFAENTPMYFEEGYLGISSESIDTLKLEVVVETKIRLRALLTVSGWQTFKWIDSFPDKLVRYADFQYFKEKIGWNTAFTSFHIPNVFKKKNEHC